MQLYLLLNKRCNMSCNFCIRGEMDGAEIDPSQWYTILEKNNFKSYDLILTGGEPSLSECLPDIIEYSQKYFRRVYVNTNGFNSEWISKCSYKDMHIQISLDGDRKKHNELRSRGDLDVFSAIEKTIQTVEKVNISYNISTVVGQRNRESVKQLMDYLYQYEKLKYWKVSPLLPFSCQSDRDMLSVDEWNSLVDYLLDNARIRLKIKKLFCFDLLDKFIRNDNFLNITNCGDVTNKIYVYPDFTVYPCTCLTDFPLGNLLDDSLFHILKNNLSDKFSNYQIEEKSVCYTCKYRRLCNGGCIGMSYYYFGKLGMGDYRCPFIKK